jgi:hypothetical protein
MIWEGTMDEPEDTEGHGLSGLTSVVVVVLVSVVIAFVVYSVLLAIA